VESGQSARAMEAPDLDPTVWPALTKYLTFCKARRRASRSRRSGSTDSVTSQTSQTSQTPRRFDGVWVDVHVLQKQLWWCDDEQDLDLAWEVVRLGEEALRAHGFTMRALGRHASKDSVMHLINAVDVTHDDRYAFEDDEYARARSKSSVAAPPEQAAAEPEGAPPLKKHRKALTTITQEWLGQRLGPGLIKEIEVVAEREGLRGIDVAASLLKYVARAGNDRSQWRIGDCVETMVTGGATPFWSKEESLAYRIVQGLSVEKYKRQRKLEEQVTGKSLLAPAGSIDISFQKTFLPGCADGISLTVDFDDYASMVPQPSPGLVGARFPVRGAVKCVLAALLKRHLHRYCIDGDVAGNLGSGDGDYDFRPSFGKSARLLVRIKEGFDGLGMGEESAAKGTHVIRGDFGVLAIYHCAEPETTPNTTRERRRITGGRGDPSNCACGPLGDGCDICGNKILFLEPKPSSNQVSHPAVLAYANENNDSETGLALVATKAEWAELDGGTIELDVGHVLFLAEIDVYPTMYDKKLERSITGQMGTTAHYNCTDCTMTQDQQRDPALVGQGESITFKRTIESNAAAQELAVRPEPGTILQRRTGAQGMKTDVIMAALDLVRSKTDTLHTDVNGSGSWIESIVIHENAQIYTWSITASHKEAYSIAKRLFHDHLRVSIRQHSTMMIAGNYGRALVAEENERVVVSLIADVERRQKVLEIIRCWRAMRTVWLSATSDATALSNYDRHRRRLHDLITNPAHLGGYISIPFYVHTHIEHTLNSLPIAPFSTESLEAGNKVLRHVLKLLSQNNREGICGALRILWLRSHPLLRELMEVETQEQECRMCRRTGHNQRTCHLRHEADEADDD